MIVFFAAALCFHSLTVEKRYRFSAASVQNAKEVKYINSPETELYHKREHLFGINHALKSIKDKNEVIVTEGEFDTILAHQNGYTNTVAIKGSALTPDHLQFLKRITQRITFALDMDPAGSEAVRRALRG